MALIAKLAACRRGFSDSSGRWMTGSVRVLGDIYRKDDKPCPFDSVNKGGIRSLTEIVAG